MTDRKAHPYNPDPGNPEVCMCGAPDPDPLHDPYRQEST